MAQVFSGTWWNVGYIIGILLTFYPLKGDEMHFLVLGWIMTCLFYLWLRC